MPVAQCMDPPGVAPLLNCQTMCLGVSQVSASRGRATRTPMATQPVALGGEAIKASAVLKMGMNQYVLHPPPATKAQSHFLPLQVFSKTANPRSAHSSTGRKSKRPNTSRKRFLALSPWH